MKITQENTVFKPVIIELKTQKEVNQFYAIVLEASESRDFDSAEMEKFSSDLLHELSRFST